MLAKQIVHLYFGELLAKVLPGKQKGNAIS